MKRSMRRFYLFAGLSLTIAALLMLSLVQPVLGTRTDFSAFNSRWNGTSQLARELYGTGAVAPAFSVSVEDEDVSLVLHSFAEYDLAPGSTTLMLIGPQRAPDAEEREWLRAFVQGGGRVVLADDFGAGNAFAEAMGAATRFDGGLLLDLSFAKRPVFVVADSFVAHDATLGLDETVLDFATRLQPAVDARVLGSTSATSWVDRNGNVFHDGNDPGGPFPWLALERVGDGEVLFLSDPSVLINGMRPLADNQRLGTNLVAWAVGGGRTVLYDESHHAHGDPVRVLGGAVGAIPKELRLALALAASGAFLVFSLGDPAAAVQRLANRPRALLERLLPAEVPPPQRDVVARAMEKHPDWDENALRDILARWHAHDR